MKIIGFPKAGYFSPGYFVRGVLNRPGGPQDFNTWRKEKIREEHKRLQLRPEVDQSKIVGGIPVEFCWWIFLIYTRNLFGEKRR